jgi:hypothetical protein
LTERRCKNSSAKLSQQPGEAGGSRAHRDGWAWWQAAPTTPGRPSTVRWGGSGKRDGKVYVRNQRLNASQEKPTSSNLTDLGWVAVRTRAWHGELPGWSMSLDGEATPKVCGVGVARPQGHSWTPNLSNGSW